MRCFGFRKRGCAGSSHIFRLSHGEPRVGGRRTYDQKWRWRDAPAAHGPRKTIDNRSIRWRQPGAFNRIFAFIAANGRKPDPLVILRLHEPVYGRCGVPDPFAAKRDRRQSN